MNIIMIFDQLQSGLGGKENPMLPLGGKMMAIGSSSMLERHLAKLNGNIKACLYCGDGYFMDNKIEVTTKLTSMVNKIGADVVICGPAYNYKNYANMCAVVGKDIEEKLNIPVVIAMSEENNEVISEYKNIIDIVKMPKKGGVGLNDSLKNICELAKMKFDKVNIEEFAKEICYK